MYALWGEGGGGPPSNTFILRITGTNTRGRGRVHIGGGPRVCTQNTTITILDLDVRGDNSFAKKLTHAKNC